METQTEYQGEVKWRIGDRVRARFGAQLHGSACTKWFPGTISATHNNGACDVAYDDGDFEAQVPAVCIKPPSNHAGITGIAAISDKRRAAASVRRTWVDREALPSDNSAADESDQEEAPGVHVRPPSSCLHCGRVIVNGYNLRLHQERCSGAGAGSTSHRKGGGAAAADVALAGSSREHQQQAGEALQVGE